MQVMMNIRLICYLALGLLFSACVVAKSTTFLRYSDRTKSSSNSIRSYEIDIDDKLDNPQAIARAIIDLPAKKSKPSNPFQLNRRIRNAYDPHNQDNRKMINIFSIPDFTTSAQIKYVGNDSKVTITNFESHLLNSISFN